MPETITKTSDRVFAAKRPSHTQPFVFQFCLVQGINFRCVAYCDQQGTWRDASSQAELFGNIQILNEDF